MKKTGLWLVLLCISASLQSQLNIQFSEPVKSKGTILQLFPTIDNDFYAIRYTGRTLGSYHLTRFSNFQPIKSRKIKMTVGNGMATLEESAVVDNQIVIFFSDKTADHKGRNNNLYVQKYNSDCMPEKEAMPLASYPITSFIKNTGKFTVLTSENRDFICVEYDAPGNKIENESFAYKIFNKNFELITEGLYEVPYERRLSQVSTRYLSNSGDYFISCNIYDLGEKKAVKNAEALEKVIMLHVQPEGLEEFEMELDGRRAMEVNYSSDDNGVMTFTGLYGNKDENGVKGIFYFRFDYLNRKEIDFGFEAFSREFITHDWSERQLKRAEKREAKGKEAPQLYNYKMRQTITLADSSIVGVMERYYVQVTSYSDPRTGSSNTTYTYIYDDLIVYKIKKNGIFDWVKKIPKIQYSTNDYGYLSSISHFMKEGKMILVFNDHAGNYNEAGLYNGNDYEVNYRKGTNVIAMVELNVATGEVDRRIATHSSMNNLYAVPKDFQVDYVNKEVLMLFLFDKKTQFGKVDL